MDNAFKKSKLFYDMLQDKKSKEVFLARLMVDFEPSAENISGLAALEVVPPYGHRFFLNEIDLIIIQELDSTVREIIDHQQNGKKLVIYGAKVWGRKLATRVYDYGSDFYGFVDRNYHLYPNGMYQKEVYSPEWLIENADDVYVVIAASNVYGSYDSIESFLKTNNFPESHIISSLKRLNHAVSYGNPCQEYFEFMSLYPEGTAYLDCGGYDGYTSIEFARYCKYNYSKIIMFEPDPDNVVLCQQSQRFNKLHDFILVQAGCSDEDGEILFESGLQGMSRFATVNDISETVEKIKTVKIDSVVKNDKVGFIKMDIEGAEMLALKGASETIKRDKPLLAICVYHKPGDTLEIMDYLYELVPEYRFWLRHYAEDASETVLYASI